MAEEIANPEKTEAPEAAPTPSAPRPRRRTTPRPEESREAVAPEAAVQAEAEATGEEQKSAARKAKAEDLELNRENVMLFGKYPIKDVVVSDASMTSYVRFNMQAYPNIFGRRRRKSYYDSHISIIERLINKLMRGGTGKKVGGKVIRTNGRLQGKKLKVLHIVENSFAIINRKTGKNPVQVFVDALQNSAPIEDTTRVRYGGISYNVAVGISANRRVDVALKNIALAALIGAFKKRKSLSEALAEEVTMAATNAPDSYAIKKRVESERIARRAR